jgi:hypothetical protein
MRRLAFAVVLSLALLATLGHAPVRADPTNGRNAELITLTCGGATVEIVVSAAGIAGHVVDGPGVLIPVAFQITGTFTDPETGELVPVNESFGVGQGKRVGQQGDLVTCTFPIVEEGFTGTATVALFAAPRGR